MKKTGNWLWGGVLIALGIILGINALGLAHISIFFPGWWTLFIIVPCFIGLFTDNHKWGQFVGLLFGVFLLLGCLDVISFKVFWKLLFPAILIAIGLGVIFRNISGGNVQARINEARREQRHKGRRIVEAEVVEDEKDDDDDIDTDERDADFKEYWSTFGDQDIDYGGKTFTGCRVDAVFGGADIDLRKAKIQNKAILRASSIFGGIIVYVPENVKVEVSSISIFGGVSDKRRVEKKESGKPEKTLYIEATCIFGGVEIR